MEPLARLPVFYALAGKRAVLAGGTAGGGLEGRTALGGRRRGRRLRAAIRPTRCCALAAEPPQGAIVAASARAGSAADLAGAAIAVGAFEDDGEAARSPPRRARPACRST